MGTFTESDGVSLAELLIDTPVLVIAAWLVYRHGIRNNSGFIFLCVFGILRIIGSIANLVTISDPTRSATLAYMICSSAGLTPLFIATSGMLSRANDCLRRESGRALPNILFLAYRLYNTTAIVLAIYGLTRDLSNYGLEHPKMIVKIGVSMYVFSWVALNALLIILYTRCDGLPNGEKRTLLAVALCSPFLAVRVIYGFLVFFVNNSTFGLVKSNVTISIFMSFVPEIGICAALLGIGITLYVHRDGATAYIKSKDKNGMIPEHKYYSETREGVQWYQPEWPAHNPTHNLDDVDEGQNRWSSSSGSSLPSYHRRNSCADASPNYVNEKEMRWPDYNPPGYGEQNNYI